MRRLALASALAAAIVSAGCNSPSKTNISPDGTAKAVTAAATTANPSDTAVALPDAAKTTAKGVFVDVAAQDTDALSLIRTKRLEAKAEGRVLVVFASASWCEPCRRLKDEVHSGRLDGKLPNITLLAFDADNDKERLAGAGYTFQFIPFVALPGPDGHPVGTAEAKGKGSNAWREVVAKLEEWQSQSK